MRRTAGLLTTAAAVLAMAATPAAAAPPGQGLVIEGGFHCGGRGETTLVRSSGNSVYIGDQHYVVASFTNTPTGGTASTHTAGNKNGLSGPLSCSRQLPDRLFTVVLLPVPPA